MLNVLEKDISGDFSSAFACPNHERMLLRARDLALAAA